mgnify:CR=1 FL=1
MPRSGISACCRTTACDRSAAPPWPLLAGGGRGDGEAGDGANADGKLQVAISDTGAGMRPETVARIFDPGFTTKGVGVGTGLGLSICYRIMQDHHGEIRVQSAPGEGSTFTVVLPLDLDKILGKDL